MRDIIFKNLTSQDKKRKIIVSNETFEKGGIRTHITRHLICLVKKIEPNDKVEHPMPYLYILKERNNQKEIQKFIFRLKGSIFTISGGNLYLITFLHSLKIFMNTLNKEHLQTGT